MAPLWLRQRTCFPPPLTYRGASPITQAIINGDAEAGVSIMQLDEGMDTGAVHAMSSTPIEVD